MANEFSFVETDAAKIYNIVMTWLMDSVNEPLYPADERRIYGEALIYVLVNVYNEMNDTARQRTLQYARGYVLDALGERTGTVRLKPSSAHDTFRFSVETPININIVIPQGTSISQVLKTLTERRAAITVNRTRGKMTERVMIDLGKEYALPPLDFRLRVL